ncbi:MAG: glycoside hydrolase family 3 N-terminal domain-containing protein [Myxococcota bacterium]
MLSGAAVPSLEHQIGQMLMLGFQGSEVHEGSLILEDIQRWSIGGVVLFQRDLATGAPVRNIVEPKQLRRLIHTLRGAAATPLWVAIDEEGGQVHRLKEHFGLEPSWTAESLGRTGNTQETIRQALRTARVLREMGINLNFAPVVDLRIDGQSPSIGAVQRSFGGSAEQVFQHARAVSVAHRRYAVLGVPKHFPGHGSAREDSHDGLPDVTKTWSNVELIPYRRLMDEDLCGAVMVGHLFHRDLDPHKPATLSKSIVTDLLRHRMGFTGVVISDDLHMAAIAAHNSLRQTLKLAIQAGVDILMFSNNRPGAEIHAEELVATIKDLVESHELPRSLIRQAYARISSLKHRMAQWSEQSASEPSP